SPLRQPLLSNLTYHAWREGAKTVDSFAAYRSQAYTVGRPDGAVRLPGTSVTPSLFGLLGESPALGRFFQAEEGEAGNDAFLVLSDHAWHATFNADPSIVGRGVIVDGKPYQVVGVARPGFYFPDRDSQVWTPMAVRRPSPDAVAGRAGGMTVV